LAAWSGPSRPACTLKRKKDHARACGERPNNRGPFGTLLASPSSETYAHAERDGLSRTVHFTSSTPNHTGPINLLRFHYPVYSNHTDPDTESHSGSVATTYSRVSAWSYFFSQPLVFPNFMFFQTPCDLRPPAQPVTLYTLYPHLMVE